MNTTPGTPENSVAHEERIISCARDLLAFSVYIKSCCPLNTQYTAEIPRDVYESVTTDLFQEVFSDILSETQPDIDNFLLIKLTDSPNFRLFNHRYNNVIL